MSTRNLTYEFVVAVMVALVITGLITNFGEGIIPDALADSERLGLWLFAGAWGVIYGAIKLVQWRVRRSEEQRRPRQ